MKTEDFKEMLEDWITEHYDDFDDEEINNIREITNGDLETISEIDNTILLRLIDEPKELVNEIEERTNKQESKNAFDDCE